MFGNNKRGLDLNDIPGLFLPPESEVVLGEKRGAWHVKYAFQQYLWQDHDNPSRGWGLFGHAGVWDDNPSPMKWSMTLGITGSPPIESRPLDKFGIGYFHTSLSDALRRGLDPILELQDEYGLELFYTWQVATRLRLTPNVQIIESGIRAADTTAIVGCGRS